MLKSKRLLVGAIAGTLFIVGGAVGGMALRDAQAPLASSATSTAEDSVKVHGHWRFDILDQGKPQRTVEFDNQLASAAPLAAFLSTGFPDHLRQVVVSGNPSPCTKSGQTVSCEIVDVGAPAQEGRSATLTATHVGGDMGQAARWSGTFIPARDSAIYNVWTGFITPSVASGYGFTVKALPTPVNVLAGQQVVESITLVYDDTGERVLQT